MVGKGKRVPSWPCLRCGELVTRGRAEYLMSISHGRNVGPFHRSCAAILSEAEENRIWEQASTLLAERLTYGPTEWDDYPPKVA